MGAEKVVDLHHFDFEMYNPDMAVRIRFRNGSSLNVVANSLVAYSNQLQALLEKQTEKSLQEFEA
eukprot:scaffold1918_cov154-Amphora_coffeaeformis.AAC.17